MNEFLGIVEAIKTGGVLFILVALVYGGYKQWWHWGYVVEDLKLQVAAAQKDSNDWKTLYLGVIGHQTRLVEALEVAIRQEK